VQGDKLVNVASFVEEFDPSTCNCDVLLRHRRISIFERPSAGKLGGDLLWPSKRPRAHQKAGRESEIRGLRQ
jgi:hypothetical protein